MRPAKALLILGLVAVAQLVAGDTEIAEAEVRQ